MRHVADRKPRDQPVGATVDHGDVGRGAVRHIYVRPFGIERVILAMQSAGATAESGVGYFIAHSGDAASTVAFKLAEDLRDKGNTVLLGAGGSFKSQLKKADANGARYALIIGDDEVAAGSVTRKDLRDGTQETLRRETLINSGKT